AWEKKVPLTFSTDFDYWNERMKDEKTGEWLTRGELSIAFLETWKAAAIPAPDILRALTVNGYRAADIIKERGPIREGFFADFIAVAGETRAHNYSFKDGGVVLKKGRGFKKGGKVRPGGVF